MKATQSKSLATDPQRKTPSYKQPPVHEVVIGFSFSHLAGLKIPHLGLLWDRFREDYPTVEHAIPLGGGEQIVLDTSTGLPLPRVWFIDKSETRVIQIQSDRFYFNWRHRKNEDVYPRYRNIESQFKANLLVLEAFLNEMKLGVLNPTECELTYINHIPKSEGWETIDELAKVFTDLCWNPKEARFLPKPKNLAWQAAFVLPDNKGQLRIRLSEATRKTDLVPLIVLELNARGIGDIKTTDQIWNWYSVAHDWIVNGFADITTQEMQFQKWGREDVAS